MNPRWAIASIINTDKRVNFASSSVIYYANKIYRRVVTVNREEEEEGLLFAAKGIFPSVERQEEE